MIRKPIGAMPQIILGIASFFVLIGVYTLISSRASQRNPDQKTVPGWTTGDRSLAEGVKKIIAYEEDSPKFRGIRLYPTRMFVYLFPVKEAVFAGLQPFKPWMFEDSGISMWRFALGMLLGGGAALVIGIVMGCFTPVEAFLRPPISFLASIPPTAMIAVYMILFGLKLQMFVAVIGVGIFPTLALSIYQAVKNDVADAAINKAYTLGASQFEIIWEVVIPQILPRIIDAIRLQVGPAMIFLIAVEYSLGSEGIGYRLRNAPRGNFYNVIYIYLVILGLFGLAVNWSLLFFRRWWCPWFEGSTS